jgi:hypothetical protein
VGGAGAPEVTVYESRTRGRYETWEEIRCIRRGTAAGNQSANQEREKTKVTRQKTTYNHTNNIRAPRQEVQAPHDNQVAHRGGIFSSIFWVHFRVSFGGIFWVRILGYLWGVSMRGRDKSRWSESPKTRGPKVG